MRYAGIWVSALAAAFLAENVPIYLIHRSTGMVTPPVLYVLGVWTGLGCMLFAQALRQKRGDYKRVGSLTFVGCWLFVLLTLALPIVIMLSCCVEFHLDLPASLNLILTWTAQSTAGCLPNLVITLPVVLVPAAVALLVFAKLPGPMEPVTNEQR